MNWGLNDRKDILRYNYFTWVNSDTKLSLNYLGYYE